MLSTPFVSVPPRDYGGTELIVFELVEGLLDQGHEITVYATGDSATRAELNYLYSKAQWPPSPLVEVNHVSWALREIARGDFDVVHAHSAPALGMSRLLPHIPMVYTIHHDRVQGFSLFYRCFPEVQFVAISENQRRLETKLQRCEVIHHGLDPARFHCTHQPKNYVCFVGRFSEEKGPHIAIDAARKAGVPIHVAGRVHPPDIAFGKREMEPRLGLPHVTYLGCVGLSQKVPLLRNARALLAPLQWEEPFGLIMIEAMLSGCPVVAFPRGSAPELVEPGITGFLANSEEEMAELIHPGGPVDGVDRELCRARAVQKFSRERFVSDHIRLYQRVLGGHRDERPQEAPVESCAA